MGPLTTTALRLLLPLILSFLVHRIIQFRRVIKSFGSLPGYRTLLPQHSIIGGLLPAIRGISVGHTHFYEGKWEVFNQFNADIIANISLLSSRASIELANAEATKEIFSSRFAYPKPLDLPVYEQLSSFGKNIVVSEGEEWRRFRRIAGPAFNERNTRLVWNETIRIARMLFEGIWGDKDLVEIEHAPDLTLELSLLVIGSAGFGREVSWSKSENKHRLEEKELQSRMLFLQSLHIVSDNLLLKLFLNQMPSWVPPQLVDGVVDLVRGRPTSNGHNSEKCKDVRRAFIEFERYMHEMIDTRRGRLELSQSQSPPSQSQSFQSSSPKTSTRHSRSNELSTIHEEPEPESEIPGGRDDLFTNLLDANEAYTSDAHENDHPEESKQEQKQGPESMIGHSVTVTKLTDEELIGNVFMFLLAGHETTAYTLTFAMTMLALYPQEQEKLYKHVKEVLGTSTSGGEGKIRIPKYEDMPLLTLCLAVIYETLRMFPTGSVRKTCKEDTTISVTSSSQNQKAIIPIPKGTEIVINSMGLHYNPRYWKDPETFNPSRFLGEYPKDAFVPFSAGARSCIGRRFSEAESVAFITLLVSRYTIEMNSEPEFVNESFEERKRRILRAYQGISLTPYRIPLVLRRRVD